MVTRLASGLAISCSLVACGGPTVTQSGAAPEPAVVSLAEPPKAAPISLSTASTTASAAPVAADLPAPTASSSPPAAQERVTIQPLKSSRFLGSKDLELFNGICQLRETKDGAGCSCCPDEPAAVGCAKNATEPKVNIEHVYRGAFSAPGTHEAYATGLSFECGNLGAWGVNWFFRRDGTEWKTVRTESSTHHVLHASIWNMAKGRHGLVSHEVISKNHYHTISFTTFALDGKASRAELLSWSNAGCPRRPSGFYNAVATYKGANNFDYNKDGRRDLVVTLEVRRRFGDASFEQACGKSYDTGISPFDAAPKQKHVIPLLFDGTQFRVEPKALARFNAANATVNKQGNAFLP
jgi:hypothetical protein